MSAGDNSAFPPIVDALASRPPGDQRQAAEPTDDGPPVLQSHLQIPSRTAPAATQTSLPPTPHLTLGQQWRQATANLQRMTAGESKAYGAPRVFDLFTLLAITLAFALLFAMLGMLAPAFEASATNLTVLISLFVAMVGVAQMWLFGANNPRLASLIGGTVAAVLISSVQLKVEGLEIPDAVVSSLCFSIFVGPVAGYLAGAIVAGVFLVADKLRQLYTPADRAAARKDISFDEIQ